MHEKPIQTIHVFSKKNEVFVKKKMCVFSAKKCVIIKGEEWNLINFKWVPIVNHQEKFKV
jgi:hypothetical protein